MTRRPRRPGAGSRLRGRESRGAAEAGEAVVLWRVPLDVDAVGARQAFATLSASERERARRFRRPGDGTRWAVSRAALRDILARSLDRDPATVELEVRPGGKPVLGGDPAGLHFSLSHSGDLAVIAVSRDAPVGVDCERIRPLGDMDALADRVFAPGERDRWRAVPEPGRLRAFFELWTCKESVIKATGDGLTAALDRVEIGDGGGGAPRVLRYPGRDPDALGWTVFRLDLGPSYAGAVTVLTGAAGYRFARPGSGGPPRSAARGDRSPRTGLRRTRW